MDRRLVVVTSQWATEHPTLASLYAAMGEAGCEVQTASLAAYVMRRNARQKTDAVFHLNWLDHLAGRRPLASRMQVAAKLLFVLLVARLRSRRVWWTVHNLAPHEPVNTGLYRFTLPLIFLLVPTVHFLARSTRIEFFNRYRWLRRWQERCVVTRMPGAIPTGMPLRSSRRVREKVPWTVFLVFGVLRPSKQVVELIRSFRETEGVDRSERVLVIAGRPIDQTYAAALTHAAEDADNIDLRLGTQSDVQIAALFESTDWCMFPYKSTTNSAALITALRAGLPVLATPLPYFQEVLGQEPLCGEYLPLDLAISRSSWRKWAQAPHGEGFEELRSEARRLGSGFRPEVVARELLRVLAPSPVPPMSEDTSRLP